MFFLDFIRKIFTKRVELRFEIEETNIWDYVWSKSYEEFKKYLKNYMIDAVNKGRYEKAEVAKELLSWLFFIEKSKKRLDK